MKQITLNIDSSAMFDLVKRADDNGAALGSRLVMMLMTSGEMSVIEAIGLAVYGVTVTDVRDVPAGVAPVEGGSA